MLSYDIAMLKQLNSVATSHLVAYSNSTSSLMTPATIIINITIKKKSLANNINRLHNTFAVRHAAQQSARQQIVNDVVSLYSEKDNDERYCCAFKFISLVCSCCLKVFVSF